MKLRLSGVASGLPAASMARTSKVCAPSASPLYALGLEHEAQDPASRRHWRLEPASEELKEKLALLELIVPDGPAVIVVSGAVVSGAVVSGSRAL